MANGSGTCPPTCCFLFAGLPLTPPSPPKKKGYRGSKKHRVPWKHAMQICTAWPAYWQAPEKEDLPPHGISRNAAPRRLAFAEKCLWNFVQTKAPDPCVGIWEKKNSWRCRTAWLRTTAPHKCNRHPPPYLCFNGICFQSTLFVVKHAGVTAARFHVLVAIAGDRPRERLKPAFDTGLLLILVQKIRKDLKRWKELI